MFCNFCHSCGVCGPHDHKLRSYQNGVSIVTCPVLKKTVCQKCGELGHTKMYCKNTAVLRVGSDNSAGVSLQIEDKIVKPIIHDLVDNIVDAMNKVDVSDDKTSWSSIVKNGKTGKNYSKGVTPSICKKKKIEELRFKILGTRDSIKCWADEMEREMCDLVL